MRCLMQKHAVDCVPVSVAGRKLPRVQNDHAAPSVKLTIPVAALSEVCELNLTVYAATERNDTVLRLLIEHDARRFLRGGGCGRRSGLRFGVRLRIRGLLLHVCICLACTSGAHLFVYAGKDRVDRRVG